MTDYPYTRRILIGLIALVFFWAWLDSAHAETIPATGPQSTYADFSSCLATGWGKTGTGSSCAAACASLGAQAGAPSFTWSGTYPMYCFNAGQPHTGTYVQPSCPSGYQVNSGNTNCVKTNSYVCPDGQGWTLNGTTCSRPDCAAGQFRATDGTCKKDCSAKNGQPTVNGRYTFPGSGSVGDVGGCQVTCKARVYSGGGWSGEDCGFNGRPAEPGDGAGSAADPLPPEEPQTPTDCGAKGMGYIQGSTGKITCVPAADAPPENQPTTVTDKTTKTTGTPPSSGSGTGGTPGTGGAPGTPGGPAGSTTESTSCKGPNCTTTTKTTTDPDTTANGTGNGGCPSGWTLVNGKCESTVVTEQPTTDYCQRNPLAPQCKGLTDECAQNPDRASCKNLGTPPTEGAVSGVDRGVSSISVVGLASSDNCPANPVLPAGLGVYDWQPTCQWASSLKPVVLALAWLAAGLIVIGGIKD